MEKLCQRDSIITHLSGKQKISSLQTHCTLYNETDAVHTDYCFLHWDDFFKKSWIKSSYRLFFTGLKTYADIFSHFSWTKLLKLHRSPIITLFYPFLTLVTFPLIVTLFASLFYHDYGTPFIYFIFACLVWIKLLPKLNSLWLLRFFIFNNDTFIHYNHDYDKRAKEFADIITQSFADDYDEILLIAHSNGSIASIPILNHLETIPSHFKIVTLGHCLPLITMNKSSVDYIQIVQKVSQKNLQWFDIGFPPDGACYTKTNPFHTYQYKQESVSVDFKAVSAQFFKYYTPEHYKILQNDKFKLHFSYLCTHDKKSPTEFIDILISNQPIENRFI